MLNIFSRIRKNSRWTYKYNDRTIIIEETTLFNVAWYYLDEWWGEQPRYPKLYKNSRLWFLFNVQKYKYV